MSSPSTGLLRQRKGSGDHHHDSTAIYTAKYVEAIADKAPATIKPYIQKAAPFIGIIADAIYKTIPFFIFAWNKICELWVMSAPYKPELLFPAFAGFIMCFFGGTFITLIAAFEAYRMCGWEQSYQALKDLGTDFKKLEDDNKVDDAKDDNNDGVADVLQMSASELATRKVLLFCRSVDPNRMGAAISGLNTGFLAVVATLKLHFAQAITLGVSIGKILEPPAKRILVPFIDMCLPLEYKKWAIPIVVWSIKSMAISFAWMIQRIISAVHSALRGGFMFSRNILKYLSIMKYVEINHEETYIDEIVGFAVAGLGLWFQFSTGFSLFFPLNIILLPFRILEYLLMWIVNSK